MLKEMHVIGEGEVFRTKPGNYFVRMSRGPYFKAAASHAHKVDAYNSPLLETLRTIGFDDAPAIRLIRRFPTRLLSEWCDITQAAQERHGPSFFSKSPMAFLVDSVDKAHKGERTPPDWWQSLKRDEEKPQELTQESKAVMAKLRSELFGAERPALKTQEERRAHVESVKDIFNFDY